LAGRQREHQQNERQLEDAHGRPDSKKPIGFLQNISNESSRAARFPTIYAAGTGAMAVLAASRRCRHAPNIRPCGLLSSFDTSQSGN